jgi:hypothetical protein
MPVEEWPLCDCLLSWHSDGFPLRKAQAYAALRRPVLVNDVAAQDILLDRRRVYQRLQVGAAQHARGPGSRCPPPAPRPLAPLRPAAGRCPAGAAPWASLRQAPAALSLATTTAMTSAGASTGADAR